MQVAAGFVLRIGQADKPFAVTDKVVCHRPAAAAAHLA